jgi:coniferyl-aldehyde dehydrogenase
VELPLYLAIGPLVAAIAAGNRALVKMSESAPATGDLLARLISGRFDSGRGRGREWRRRRGARVRPPSFDHLLFTGSTEVGRQVMRAAADNLTPVTLELGGKSPAIVARGVPVAEAAAKILFGKCVNAGQTCIAPDYALVPRERVDAFAEAAREAVARLYPTLAPTPTTARSSTRATTRACTATSRKRGAAAHACWRSIPRRGPRHGPQDRAHAAAGHARGCARDARGDLRPAAAVVPYDDWTPPSPM